jgi:hypothetical protein
MGLLNFFGLKFESLSQYAEKITLENDYDFMHENFIISSQQNLFLFLEENNGIIEALNFEFKVYKYGYPNDEVGLTSKIPGVAIYGISEVFNSNWINELMINNRSHPRHQDKFYSNYKHYVVRLKEVTLEVICQNYEIVKITKEEFNEIINTELQYIKK